MQIASHPSPGIYPDPYRDSVAIARLRRELEHRDVGRVAFLDIDSTLTGDGTLADGVRSRLEALGYVIVFDTSRTEEMLMTRALFDRSTVAGYLQRPEPHLGMRDRYHVYVPVEDHEPAGLLDADIIAASTGTRILIRQQKGMYVPDLSYEQPYGQSGASWRKSVLDLLQAMDALKHGAQLASIDRDGAYEAQLSDIFPPTYRIQLNFDCLAGKMSFIKRLKETRGREDPWGRVAHAVRVTDDSKPETGTYKVFLTPRKGSKVRAAEQIIRRLTGVLNITRSRLHLLFAGDSFPDLAMGLFGGLGTPATFLLAGGSRLAQSLIDDTANDFAGEGVRAIRRRLRSTDQMGHYWFRMPYPARGTRRLIIGDQAFPGTTSVETVYRYVQTLERTWEAR